MRSGKCCGCGCGVRGFAPWPGWRGWTVRRSGGTWRRPGPVAWSGLGMRGQLGDELLSAVAERVRPHRADGHGESWSLLTTRCWATRR